MTRLPDLQVDEAPTPSVPRTPSPAILLSEDDEDHDHEDDLSINSSDLDEEGWLNVDPASSVAASTTASALGSSTISDFPLSSREPSDAGVSESSDTDDDVEPAWTSTVAKHKGLASVSDSLYDDETPISSSQTNAFEFKSSWIFPDPTSASGSLTTTSGGTATDNTPLQSLANIRSISRSNETLTQEEDETDNTPKDVAKRKAAPGNPFHVNPAGPQRKRWSLVAMVLGLLVLLIKIGPSARLDLASIMSHTFGQNRNMTVAPASAAPARSSWALGSTDLQIVKDTLAALKTNAAPAGELAEPKTDMPTEAPIVFTEYSYVWSKLRRNGKTSTDLIATASTKSLSVVPRGTRRHCQCPPQQCRCPPSASILDQLKDGLIALDAYARWMSDIVVGLAYHAGEWIRNEIELEYKFQQAIINDFVKSPTVRIVVEHAANSPKVMRRVYLQARDRVCANGRCERAAAKVRDAKVRGWRSVKQARRGLDVARNHGHRLANDAVARSTEFIDGAVAGARSVAERAAEHYARTQEKTTKAEGERGRVKRCGGREAKSMSKCNAKGKSKGYTASRGARHRWRRGKDNDPNQRLQCGFRGYGRRCVEVRFARGKTNPQL